MQICGVSELAHLAEAALTQWCIFSSHLYSFPSSALTPAYGSDCGKEEEWNCHVLKVDDVSKHG